MQDVSTYQSHDISAHCSLPDSCVSSTWTVLYDFISFHGDRGLGNKKEMEVINKVVIYTLCINCYSEDSLFTVRRSYPLQRGDRLQMSKDGPRVIRVKPENQPHCTW